MTQFMRVSRNHGNTKRIISAIAVTALLVGCMFAIQMSGPSQSASGSASTLVSVPVGGNLYWDIVGSMILYRDDSSAGSQSYWVAQSFNVTKPAPTVPVVSLLIYVWLTRDIPPDSSFPRTADNITVLLTNATADGNPNIADPIASQTIGPQNITAAGPYPQGLMETNNSLAVTLRYDAPNPITGFEVGKYFIFFYRQDLGDHDDYHIGYTYYWAASKLDIYYEGESWMLDNKGEWESYPNDMCFLLVEITYP